MKILILSLLFITLVSATPPRDLPNFKGFNFEAGGSYIGYGVFVNEFVYPGGINSTGDPDVIVKFAINPNAKFLYIQFHPDTAFGGTEATWITNNGSYFLLFGTCYQIVNRTYDQEVANWKWCRQFDNAFSFAAHQMADYYVGMVSAIGTCSSHVTMAVVQGSEQSPHAGKVLKLSYQLPFPTGPLPTDVTVPHETLVYNQWMSGDFDPLVEFPLPAACSSPVPWCANIFPNQDGQCNYPPKNAPAIP